VSKEKPMRFHVVTLFPEMILQALSHGVVGQAIQADKLQVEVVNPREFTSDPHRTVDDRPFGGGDGMVMLPDPLEASLRSVEARLPEGRRLRKIYLSARGRVFTDAVARELASQEDEILLLCGRYGGVDQRFIEARMDEELSIGDYVLSGGEIAAMVVIDAVGRLRPGVLGNAASSEEESFADGLLEYPQYTRPRIWNDWAVPAALVSGNHLRIDEWRRDLAVLLTADRRPELLRARGVSEREAVNSLKQLSQMRAEERRACGIRSYEEILRERIDEARRDSGRRS
jgi:tRNA (guanine37-N1)-methyltransferase